MTANTRLSTMGWGEFRAGSTVLDSKMSSVTTYRCKCATTGDSCFVRVPSLAAPQISPHVLLLLLFLISLIPPAHGRERKTKKEDFGLGFSTEIAAPETEVIEAVKNIVNDGIIQGSKEYNKDKFIEKADSASSSSLFTPWDGPGTVFYKVREKVLSPTSFKESSDEGTLAVRYIVTPKDATRTILRIDAVFVEDFRRVVHPSDGSVESAEYRDIQDRVDAIELDKKETLDAQRHRQEELARQSLEQKKQLEQEAELAAAQGSSDDLEKQVESLRHQVERVIKAPGANLKAAPYHTASTLKSLPAGSNVVILIVTSYWYGIETEDGQHGWIHHSQLEPLP
jgi:hypothetical protein